MSQKKMRDIGQSQEKKCQGCDEVEGVVRSRFYECLCWKGMIQLEREGRKCFLCYWEKGKSDCAMVGRWCSCKKVWPFGNAIDAEFEEQRTTKKADLWAVHRGVHAHLPTRTIKAFWRAEDQDGEVCIGPLSKYAD